MSGGGDIVLQGGTGGGSHPQPDKIDRIIDLCKRQFTAAFMLLLLSFIGHFVTGITISRLRERVEVLELAAPAAVASDK